MDENNLHSMRREPRPEFARELRERLRALEDEAEAPAFRLRPALALGLAVVALTVAFLVPSVRVSAQAMLDLFRIRQFAVVEIDPTRLDKLHALKDQNGAMLAFDHQEVTAPGPPKTYATRESAGAAAGFVLKQVTSPANGMKLGAITVQGPAEGRLTLHDAKLRVLLDQLGLNDVRIPSGFDGQPITVRKPPIATEDYSAGKFRATLIQARSPEVGLPPGADLAKIGEVGLRVLGLDAGEARRLAGSIDWHSTLLVPVPLNASTFRPVTIQGNNGLLITLTGKVPVSGEERRGSMVMWTEGDRVLAIQTNLSGTDAVLMAESVR